MDDDTILLGKKAYSSLKVFMTTVSVLRFLIPKLHIIYEEEVMGFLSVFDLDLIPWIVFNVILGRQLKKVDMPTWMPPLPALLLLVSFIICAAFGWIHTDATGSDKMVATVLTYGVGNGCFVGLLAMGGYDIAHSFMKEKWKAIKAWLTRIFKKR